MTATRTAPARGPAQLVRDRAFGPFMVGKIASSSGTWVQNIAAAVLMFELTRSAVMVGAVSVVQFAGSLLFSLWAGALTDRFDRRKLLVAGRLVSGVAVGLLAVLLVLVDLRGLHGAVIVLVAMFVMGLGLAVSVPAMQALVPALVADEDLEQALALSSAAPSVARTVGPALGAGLLLLGGPALAFAVAAGSHALLATTMVFVRARPQKRPAIRPSVLGGLRYLRDDRNAGKLMLAVALIGFGADPVVTLTPPLAEALGGGSDAVGLFASAFGLGALVLIVLFGRVRRLLTLRQSGMTGFWILAAGLVATAFSPTLWVAAGGFLVAGFGFMLSNVALTTRIQRRVPDELRGRVMALWGVAFLGSRPFAAMVNGTLADLVSLEAGLLCSAVVVASAAVLARVRYTDGR